MGKNEIQRCDQGTAASANLARIDYPEPRPKLPEIFGNIQRRETDAAPDASKIREAARRGISTPVSSLPYAARIQRLFGRHDISRIQAHVGGEAAASARAMGAEAYATGEHVVLKVGADLHTVSHEVAHVIQQRAGVQLSEGVGTLGDRYEQHADEVASLVVKGESAESVLDRIAPQHAKRDANTADTALHIQCTRGSRAILATFKRAVGLTAQKLQRPYRIPRTAPASSRAQSTRLGRPGTSTTVAASSNQRIIGPESHAKRGYWTDTEHVDVNNAEETDRIVNEFAESSAYQQIVDQILSEDSDASLSEIYAGMRTAVCEWMSRAWTSLRLEQAPKTADVILQEVEQAGAQPIEEIQEGRGQQISEAVPGGFDNYMVASKHFIKRVDEKNSLGPVDLKAYLPEEFKAVGEQVSVDMSMKRWRQQISRLDSKADYLYVVRNAKTGEVLKVGKTSDLLLRLADYRTANNKSVEHGGSVTVDLIQVEKPPGMTLETGEGAVRDGILADAEVEATVNGRNADKVLPWDKSGSNSGPGTPGSDSHNMKYDLTKWEGDHIVELTKAERNEFMAEVGKKYRKPPADIAAQVASKSNAEIARDNNVPPKVARLWRKLVEKGFL